MGIGKDYDPEVEQVLAETYYEAYQQPWAPPEIVELTLVLCQRCNMRFSQAAAELHHCSTED